MEPTNVSQVEQNQETMITKEYNEKVQWKCPFYIWNERFCIHGECGRIRFPDEKSINEYSCTYCANESGWKNCTLAKVLLRYYERMEGVQ